MRAVLKADGTKQGLMRSSERIQGVSGERAALLSTDPSLARGERPGLGQAQVKEMQVWEDGDERKNKHESTQTEELSVQTQEKHRNCHCTLSHNLMP